MEKIIVTLLMLVSLNAFSEISDEKFYECKKKAVSKKDRIWKNREQRFVTFIWEKYRKEYCDLVDNENLHRFFMSDLREKINAGMKSEIRVCEILYLGV